MKEGSKHVMGNEGREGRKQTENEEEEEDEDEAMQVRTLISIFFLHTLLFSLTYEKFKNKRKFDRFFLSCLQSRVVQFLLPTSYLLGGSRQVFFETLMADRKDFG